MTHRLKHDPAAVDTAPASGPFTSHRLRQTSERRPLEPHPAPDRDTVPPADFDAALARLESSLATFDSEHAEAAAEGSGADAVAASHPPDFDQEVDLATLDLTTERLLAWMDEDRARHRRRETAGNDLTAVLRAFERRLERVEAACGLAPRTEDDARLAGRFRTTARRADAWPPSARSTPPPGLDRPVPHDPERSDTPRLSQEVADGEASPSGPPLHGRPEN